MSEIELLEKINGLLKRVDYLERLPRIATVPWTDYSATSTVVGWSSFTLKEIYYKKVGRLVFVEFSINGTSNSTSTTFTLPYISHNSARYDMPIRAYDNGNIAAGIFELSPNSNLISFYPTFSGGNWTASGNKAIWGQCWYEAAT